MALPTDLPAVPAEPCCAPAALTGLDTATAQAISDDLAVLAHPIRLQILALLAHQESVCVCELEAALPVKQPTVSHHLKLLREAGLIVGERRGLWVYYGLQREAVAAVRARIVTQLTALG